MKLLSKKMLITTGVCALLSCSMSNAYFDNTPQKPSFTDYAVDKVYQGKNAAIDYTSKNIQIYRSQLDNAINSNVNFAGHYILTTWGCGAACTALAIIDAQTGKVYLQQLYDVHAKQKRRIFNWHILDKNAKSLPKSTTTNTQTSYSPNSNLLIVYGDPNNNPKQCPREKLYYVWKNNQLTLIKAEVLINRNHCV